MIQKLRLLLGLKKRTKHSDIVVISYPKAGRTWFRFLLGKYLQLHFDSDFFSNEADYFHFRYSANHMPVPSISFSHDDDPHTKKTKKLSENKEYYRNTKVIFLVRDPRDLIVSLFFQLTKRSRKKKYRKSLSHFIRDKNKGILNIIRFYNIWAENIDLPKNFLLIKYEDLHNKPNESLNKALQFIGIQDINENYIRQAITFASFDNMRKIEEKGSVQKLKPYNAKDKESYKTRKGKIGGYRDYLKQNETDFLNETINTKLSDFYSFYKQ